MRRFAIAALVGLSCCMAASPALARGHKYRLRTHRTVVVHRYTVRRPVVVVREVVPPPRPRVSATRFVPLPVPRRAWVPPPFVPWHPF